MATAVLYHQVNFSDVLSVISYNNDFYFDDRFVVVVAIPEMVKLCNRVNKDLPDDDFDALQSWVTSEYRK